MSRITRPATVRMTLPALMALSAALLGGVGRSRSLAGDNSNTAKESVQRQFVAPRGGSEFWADVRFFQGWRIQRNVTAGHYRLINPKDIRYTSGSFQACCGKLDEIQKARALRRMSGKAVILIHGLIRSSKTFNAMRPTLERAGYTVVRFDYPSTQITIGDAAEYLNRVIESLDGIEEIDFVGYSMGGLVARAYLKEHRDPRIGRMVMLAVPNRGAEMADVFRQNSAFQMIFGPAGQQLVTHREGIIPTLPIPDCEFAIIAGGCGGDGFNPLIAGDDDMLVSVESTRLPGAADFMTVRALHPGLAANAEVIGATVRFLQTGRLRQAGCRQPIPPETREQKAATGQRDR